MILKIICLYAIEQAEGIIDASGRHYKAHARCFEKCWQHNMLNICKTKKKKTTLNILIYKRILENVQSIGLLFNPNKHALFTKCSS